MIEPSAAAANREGAQSDFLMQETAHVVSAYILNSETRRDEVPDLIRETHSALLDLYASVLGPSSSVRPLKTVVLSDFPEIERALLEIGASYADVREVPAPSVPPPAPVATVKASAEEEFKAAPPRPPKAKRASVPRPTRAASAVPDPEVLGPAPTVEAKAEVPQPAREPDANVVKLTPPSVEKQAAVPLPAPVEPAPVPMERPVAKKRPAPKKKAAPKRKPAELKLPRGVKSIGDTVRMQSITCLEDGRRVKDLKEHLASIGVSADDYRRKWKLPPEYPMMAPAAILKRGQTFEVDFVTGNMIPRL